MSAILGSDQPFTGRERKVIGVLCEGNIPADPEAKLPSASDPAILAVALRKAVQHESRPRSGLQTLFEEADPESMTDTEIVALVESNPRLRSLSRIITIITMQAYYQDHRVLTAHGLAARPPFPEGHEMEADDWSLLDPVKSRTPFYRST